MKKIVKIVIVVFTFLLLLNNVSAQNRVFPGKYDFKPMIKLYASSGNCDYGEFYSIQNDTIVLKSLSDDKLYGYSIDSISRIEFKSGPGFFKMTTVSFLTLLGVTAGILIVPHVTMIGVLYEFIIITIVYNLPISSFVGLVSSVFSRRYSFDMDDVGPDKVRKKLRRYNQEEISGSIRYLTRSLNKLN